MSSENLARAACLIVYEGTGGVDRPKLIRLSIAYLLPGGDGESFMQGICPFLWSIHVRIRWLRRGLSTEKVWSNTKAGMVGIRGGRSYESHPVDLKVCRCAIQWLLCRRLLICHEIAITLSLRYAVLYHRDPPLLRKMMRFAASRSHKTRSVMTE